MELAGFEKKQIQKEERKKEKKNGDFVTGRKDHTVYEAIFGKNRKHSVWKTEWPQKRRLFSFFLPSGKRLKNVLHFTSLWRTAVTCAVLKTPAQ
ncbi:hypothetical protein CEXT_334711 [Caerostris extrusa]|uniref:Uncharacterized protein n=1 Tax=Caerostris extrusa TaxID=172846 RepID=A0AAV4NY54_CAEEX|nr:hypothetical protein CEXT_334711 [Caerostris extrusa]